VWLFGVGIPLALTLPVNRFFLPAFPAVTAAMALALADRPESAARIALLLAALCGTTLLYYGWVDLSIPLSL
jgi:lipopolysaccharide export LptBFGC system permease protein LptF